MELDATLLDVSRVADILAGSLMHAAPPANPHRKARTPAVLIADIGSRSYPDQANPTQFASADVAAARVDRVLSRIPHYAGAGSRSGRAYFHLNRANTFVSAIEVQLAAMQGHMSQHAIDSAAVPGFLLNQILFYRQRNPLPLSVPTAAAI
eukprot:986068-Pleurochrysis_carterae.AAC.2